MVNAHRRKVLKAGGPALAATWGAGWVWPALANAPQASAAAAAALPRLGLNLSGLADWSTEQPFVDFFRLSRSWISQRQNDGWGKGSPLALDDAGWIRSLPPDQYAETPMAPPEGGFYPAGTYLVLFEGAGEIDFWGSARVMDRASGRMTIDVTPSRGHIWLRLKRTDPANPVRNIRVLRPSFDASTPANAIEPGFVRRWQGMASLRFMDWMATNGSKQASWKERPLPTHARLSEKGAPLEVMIDVANRLETDPWFCMPHLADDDYVERFAEMVKAKLNPNLNVYIEYSNELWNDLFEQARFAATAARAAKISRPAWTGVRSAHIFAIWERVFGSKQRLVRILPSQAANGGVSTEMLKYQDNYKRADALAIAPYLSFNVEPGGSGPSAAEVERWSVEKLLDHLESKSLPECIGWMKTQKTIADKHDLKLVAYEGGQHLVGYMGAENNEGLTRLLHAANAHPRMGQMYERYFEAWTQVGGGLHCHYTSVDPWTKWGSWGLLRNTMEDPKKSPKFMATMAWAKKRGQKVNLPV